MGYKLTGIMEIKKSKMEAKINTNVTSDKQCSSFGLVFLDARLEVHVDVPSTTC